MSHDGKPGDGELTTPEGSVRPGEPELVRKTAGAKQPAAAPRDIALIAFDVDGTLVDHPQGKVIWELLNKRFAGDDEINMVRYRDYKAGRIDYATWVALDVESWIAAGATRAQVRETVLSLRPTEGARETLRRLREKGYRLAVISGTLDVVLDEFFPAHPFTQVFTNRLHFDSDGLLSGWEATPFDMDGKARALEHLANLYHLPVSRCAFVGDNVNDLGVARIAGYTVAFNPKCAELEELAHVVVRSESLVPVGDLFPGVRNL
jgi:phosphoserine phosphatase